MNLRCAVSLLALGSFGTPGAPAAPAAVVAPDDGRARASYAKMVSRVAAMPEDERVRGIAGRFGLDVLNVLWEDTGRYEGSSVGPNISDVTIEVEMKSPRGRSTTALMPVLRHPNFTDKTGDVALDRIWIPVGNQVKDGALTHVSLRDFLAEPTKYMSLPDRGTIKRGTLLAKRDSHALVSAQATFLPIPADGKATFWPVIFNYQSTKRNPAVLTLLVTRQGTSLTIVDNARDTVTSESWGQRLFFNSGGERTPLIAERLSHVKNTGVTANGESADSLGADANLLMIVQVPLKVRQVLRKAYAPMMDMELGGMASGGAPAAAAPPAEAASRSRAAAPRSDVETAVLGHGPELGPYTELAGLTIERDARFPVRVTVLFYQATSNGVVAAADVKALAAQIRKVYKSADYVGSLVAPAPSDRRRPTNWDGTGPMPPGTRCEDFPGLLERGLCRPGQTAATVVTPVRPTGPTSAGIH